MSGQWPQMGALPVVVEDAKHLRRAVMSSEGVRNHGGELRRLAGLDHDGPLAKQQHNGSRQDGEPVPARMDFQLAGTGPGAGLVTRILATVTPCGPGSRLSSQVVTPRTASRCGLITTSSSATDSTS